MKTRYAQAVLLFLLMIPSSWARPSAEGAAPGSQDDCGLLAANGNPQVGLRRIPGQSGLEQYGKDRIFGRRSIADLAKGCGAGGKACENTVKMLRSYGGEAAKLAGQMQCSSQTSAVTNADIWNWCKKNNISYDDCFPGGWFIN